jgi:signal transduction histidine kinase
MIDIKEQSADIAGLFGSFCENGWLKHKKEGVNYIVENNYHHLVVIIDATHLSHIIAQITANAAQHTDNGSVIARYEYMSNRLVVTIEDTGSGISAEAQRHLFDRFSSGNSGGTGLGLPICQALTTKMGGNISIRSKVKKGTTVWITIPCKALEIDRKKAI